MSLLLLLNNQGEETLSVSQTVLTSTVPGLVELFEIDLTSTNVPALVGNVFRVATMTDSTDLANIKAVSFGGNDYVPYPIQISEVSFSSDGAPPRPKLVIANVNKYIGQLAFAYGDIIGATVTYIRTFTPYLNSSSKVSLPPLKYFIAKKTSHNRTTLSFELRDFRDKERAFLPKRQMLKKDFPGLGINKNVR
jgi:lambda family phage minor tail protein L